jgi:hypothetical protein
MGASSTVPALARMGSVAVTVTASRTFAVSASDVADPYAVPTGPASPRTSGLHTGCHSASGGVPAGEGMVEVTMAAPGTTWASPANTSVVADLSVDGGPAQQVVLYGGASPFRYEGFVGQLSSGSHCVTVTVDPSLSHVTTVTPQVTVYGVTLGIVPQNSPDWLLESHTPVLYGRSTSALGDTPLITYGQQAADADGTDVDLSYTVIWTHEDVGDGIVPAYEWGLWGRMTDIETVLHEKVSPGGKILSAEYLSCGCEHFPVYPDIVPEDPEAGGETDQPYPSSGTTPGLAEHLGIRDATGNNDISPTGTTAYRLQETLVAPPAAGQAREAAMDTNPWTYQISDEEITRESAQSTDAGNFLAGQYPQYLIVDIDSRPTGTGSVSVAVQLDGAHWYSNDYSQMTPAGAGTTFPFYNGGHARTVIKLPTNWHSSTITALRLTLNATSPNTMPTLGPNPQIQLIEVTPDFLIHHRAVPTTAVAAGLQVVPSQLGGL